MEHYNTRAKGNLELLEQLDLIGRTSELARLFGIQFYEVFTRGSQVWSLYAAVSRFCPIISPHLVSRGIHDVAANEAEKFYCAVSVGDATFANESSGVVTAYFGARIKVVCESFRFGRVHITVLFRFYTDPVLVLDFQSLYPSMIIAYNYCYSTCLGRSHLLGRYASNPKPSSYLIVTYCLN